LSIALATKIEALEKRVTELEQMIEREAQQLSDRVKLLEQARAVKPKERAQ
jgi:hypothetical protein